ncbi:unnamed protein product [Ranitomeya imitator]|uniref:SCAN box domain-containing protein n=1 Tax=Ranitomeya imitator TaxID=111125 RepID=A0ABN9LNN4_9NEOB|nr:unnamed protein product [Ranitomeya imitator]
MALFASLKRDFGAKVAYRMADPTQGSGNIGGLSTTLQNAADKPLMPLQRKQRRPSVQNAVKRRSESVQNTVRQRSESGQNAVKQRSKQRKLQSGQWSKQQQREQRRASTDWRLLNMGSRWTPQHHQSPGFPKSGPRTSLCWRRMETWIPSCWPLKGPAFNTIWPGSVGKITDPRLRGKSLEVLGDLPAGAEQVYSSIKRALNQHYNLTPESYRKKFRSLQWGPKDTWTDHMRALMRAAEHWTSGLALTTCQEVQELFVTEQFLWNCPENLPQFLRDRKPKGASATATLADEYANNRAPELKKPASSSWRGVAAESDSGQETDPGELTADVAVSSILATLSQGFQAALEADASLKALKEQAAQPPGESDRERVVWDQGRLYRVSVQQGSPEAWPRDRQLVVPYPFRAELLRIAYEIPMAGHLKPVR